jgi:7,8-dihydropterin-6-yl-methyl-4-(beta-D-ribofuranosyl)aminobenzene 5'-phosphate synthase
MKLIHTFFGLTLASLLLAISGHAETKDRVTILYDAFSDNKAVTKDWGFSALVEHDGKRILFDTGNNQEIFEHNVKALNVDLTKIDFAVISHRHADHASGLKYLLKINPDVTVYVPADGDNGFGGSEFPQVFYRPEPSLPSKMRYFDSAYPEHLRSGKLYDTGHFVLVDKLTEVAPGIFLLYTVSNVPRTLELPELTLAIKGPHGLILVDGCSHSGIEEILKAASAVDHTPTLFSAACTSSAHLCQTSTSSSMRSKINGSSTKSPLATAPANPRFSVCKKPLAMTIFTPELARVLMCPSWSENRLLV